MTIVILVIVIGIVLVVPFIVLGLLVRIMIATRNREIDRQEIRRYGKILD